MTPGAQMSEETDLGFPKKISGAKYCWLSPKWTPEVIDLFGVK
jgi:hypothetical protein